MMVHVTAGTIIIIIDHTFTFQLQKNLQHVQRKNLFKSKYLLLSIQFI